MKPRVLLVDDEPSIIMLLERHLKRAGYETHAARSVREAREAFASRRFDAAILDLHLPDGSGMDLIEEMRQVRPETALVVITGAGDIPTAVEAMRRGADNFLTKPVDVAELEVYLHKCIEVADLRRRAMAADRMGGRQEPFWGASAAIGRVRELLQIAAENDAPLLLLGETGTGKGVLARWVCEAGPKRGGPLVDLNCSSLKGELLMSELFGHRKGAFTGAHEDSAGLVEVADRGVLFLDEIGDMDAAAQAQLLKILEERTFRRVGETALRESVFRLICATNRDLEKEVSSGAFRADLFYRINVFPVRIPPLRERVQDIPALAAHLLGALGAPGTAVSGDVIRLFEAYAWPGNIRELKNVLERALLLSRGARLEPEHFPGLAGVSPAVQGAAPAHPLSLAQAEAEHVRATLARHGGDARGAARELGISRATLYRKLKSQP